MAEGYKPPSQEPLSVEAWFKGPQTQGLQSFYASEDLAPSEGSGQDSGFGQGRCLGRLTMPRLARLRRLEFQLHPAATKRLRVWSGLLGVTYIEEIQGEEASSIVIIPLADFE